MNTNPLTGLLGLGESQIVAVWVKGSVIPGYDPGIWRRDFEGRAIRFSDYGKRESEWGWEFDHIVASAFGGSDEMANLRPRHWQTNASAGGLLSSFRR